MIRIFADENNQIQRSSKDELSSRHPVEVFLSTGCKVVLPTNLLDRERIGKRCLWDGKNIACDLWFLSLAVMVHFDEYHGPFLIEILFFIEPNFKSLREETTPEHLIINCICFNYI